MKRSMLLAIILLFSANAYALHEYENPDLQGNPITEETQPSGITESLPPNEDKSWWDKTTETIGDWWAEED